MATYQSVPEPIADTVININGELVSGDEPHVSVLDRNFLYGDGVFDGMPIYDGKVVLFDRHVDRFFRSMRAAKIKPDIGKDELRQRAVETLEESELEYGAVRFIASRGIGPVGVVNTDQVTGPTMVIIPQRFDPDELAGGEVSTEKARIVSTRTVPPDSIDPGIKSCNYLSNVLAERETAETDADFGIMLDHQGRVAEAYDANIFVQDRTGTFKTPPLESALGGMTREVLLEVADSMGYETEITHLTPYDLHNATDVFMTSSGRWISYIEELDGKEIGGGTPSEKLTKLSEEVYEYIVSEEYLELDV